MCIRDRDSASHASFITEACASRLKCACFDASVSVNGVGDIATKAKKVCHLSLETLKREVVASNHAFIIPVSYTHLDVYKRQIEMWQLTRRMDYITYLILSMSLRSVMYIV